MSTNKDRFEVFEEAENVETQRKTLEMACQTDEEGFVGAAPNKEASEDEECELINYWNRVMSKVTNETDRFRKLNDDLEKEIALATVQLDAKKEEYEKRYAEAAGDLEPEDEYSESDAEDDSIIVKV